MTVESVLFFFFNPICIYSLLILITCTETLQKASHLGSRIRPLTWFIQGLSNM